MEQFSALRLFVAVADCGGFSAAAQKLNLSISAVSRSIAALEDELGIELLKRTTRRVKLTEAGSSYLAHVRELLHDLKNVNAALKKPVPPCQSHLRIAAPQVAGTHLLAPAIAAFQASQPGIVMTLDLLDRPVDTFAENYDFAFHIAPDIAESPLLMPIELGLCASPLYCAAHGRPQGPGDLERHHGLYHILALDWRLRSGPVIQPRPRFQSTSHEAVRTMCLASQGVALLPLFLVSGDIERGDLIRLLDGFEPKPQALFMSRSALRYETAAARLLADFIASWFKRRRP